MNRRSFPAGQTNGALLKALLSLVDAAKGRAAADAWLKSMRMMRVDLEDETRLVPLAQLHAALAAFARLMSREAIAEAWRQLVTPDCLGAWIRVLRGTTTPAEAFARLDSSDSEYGRTTRWETTFAGPSAWRGRVHVAHDPALEDDGLLTLGRLAELRAIPVLFGYAGDGVVARAMPPEGATSQEFEVTWRVPSVGRWAAAGGALGGLLGASSFAFTSAGTALAAAAGGLAVGGFALAARAREQVRRAETHAQTMRVHALERSLALNEARDRSLAGQIEGTVVAGQYRIVQRMGSGASGVIYEAARIGDGLPVAIKLLRAVAAHDSVASDRLRREAEALGLAWHPNVVEVIDQGLLPDGTSYLVMELLHGESLAARVRAKGRIEPADLLPIALAVCDALAAVHAAGVIHRDLKPSNIYLAKDPLDPDAPEKVKLIDFGIARVEWEETRITHTGGPLGTPGYMSPEQELGGTEVDGRSDLFSLGAVIYECLVGEPPPPPVPSGMMRTGAVATDPAAWSAAALSSKKIETAAAKAMKLIPATWRVVIDRAMAAMPENRYEDARAFAHALRAMVGDISSVPPSAKPAEGTSS